MQLFICWSGERSYQLASFLGTWLETVVDGLHVVVSSEIEKGTRWSDEIRKALGTSRAGLVCLAWEGRDSAWINYEAGALANAVDSQSVKRDSPDSLTNTSRVYPYLLDIEPRDVPAPLQQFNMTRSTKAETKKLVQSVAKLQKDAESWSKKFEEEWPALEVKLRELKLMSLELAFPGFVKLFERNTFAGEFPRDPDTWLDRYFAARKTHLDLEEHEPIVAAHCSDGTKSIYNMLRNDVKEYAMSEIPQLFRRNAVKTALPQVERRRRSILESVKKLKSV